MKNKIPVLLERAVSTALVGSPKSIDDWAEYFKKGVPGLTKLIRDLWVATHVGIPTTLVFFQTFFQWFNIFGYGNDTSAKNIVDLYWKNFVKRYNNWKKTDTYFDVHLPFPDNFLVTRLDFNPVHMLGLDLYDWINSKFDVKSGEGILNKGKKEFIEALSKLTDENLSKLRCYDKTKTREENINIIFDCMQTDVKDEVKKTKDDVVDKISSTAFYAKYPCYWKNTSGAVADPNFGDNGIKVIDDTHLQYKFLSFDKPYDVKLEYGTWRFYQDGVDQGVVSCN
jgi:hypothetical protein